MPSQPSRQAPGDPGQAEDVGGARNTGRGPALDRRGADLGVAQHVEGDRKAVHPLFEQRLERLRRHVAAGEAGAAGGDHHVDVRIGDPDLHLRLNAFDVVRHDVAGREPVARRGQPIGERCAGLVVVQRTRVRHGQDRDVERNERPLLIGHRQPYSRTPGANVLQASIVPCW